MTLCARHVTRDSSLAVRDSRSCKNLYKFFFEIQRSLFFHFCLHSSNLQTLKFDAVIPSITIPLKKEDVLRGAVQPGC